MNVFKTFSLPSPMPAASPGRLAAKSITNRPEDPTYGVRVTQQPNQQDACYYRLPAVGFFRKTVGERMCAKPPAIMPTLRRSGTPRKKERHTAVSQPRHAAYCNTLRRNSRLPTNMAEVSKVLSRLLRTELAFASLLPLVRRTVFQHLPQVAVLPSGGLQVEQQILELHAQVIDGFIQ